MNLNDMNRFIRGDLAITSRLKEDGRIIDQLDERNVVTAQGASDLLARVTKNDATVSNSYVKTIALGDDVGDGTLLSPEQASELSTGTMQSVVYTVPVSDITITYPTPFSFEISTVLDGTYILENFYPSDIEMRFTSATIRYESNKTLSYKRFPVRSLSRLVDIEIRWTISLKEPE